MVNFYIYYDTHTHTHTHTHTYIFINIKIMVNQKWYTDIDWYRSILFHWLNRYSFQYETYSLGLYYIYFN